MDRKKQLKNKTWICLSLACLALFLIILLGVAKNSLIVDLDKYANSAMQAIYMPNLIIFASWVTNIASTTAFVILAALLLGLLFYKKRFRDICFVIYTFGGAAIIGFLLKIIVHRARPENALIQELDYSFPSGHAIKSFIFFAVLIYLFKDDIKNRFAQKIFVCLSAILIAAISFSRIYLRVHWLSDVVAGLLISAFWLGLIIYLDRNCRICCFENKKTK